MLRFSRHWIAAVWTLLRKHRKFVKQTTQTDCGVASALTVLNILSLPSDPVHAVENMDAERTGTSLETLRQYFDQQHYALEAAALAVPADHVGTLDGQVILHMRQMHYVVLLHASNKGVLVFDPSRGPVHYPPADFAALYSGYLLHCKDGGKVDRSAATSVSNVIPTRKRQSSGGWQQPVALFVIGVATRILETALLLCLVVVLFLVLNQASLSSLMLSFSVIVVCSLLLLIARQIRFDGEDDWVRIKQSRLWRSILRTTLAKNDLHGFRGRKESDVAGTVRQGIAVTIPQRSQVPATMGSFAIMPLMLCLLSPVLGLVHLLYYGLVLVVTQLDSVQICRRSVLGKIGRYTKLTQGHAAINVETAPELIGELAKWTVIGVAGYGVLDGSVSAVALMFWILTAMQIVPTDFKRAPLLSRMFGAQIPVPDLTGLEVPIRAQRLVSKANLDVSRDGRWIIIDGISALTMPLRQPDLTVREQRLIIADVVYHVINNLPEGYRVKVGPVRIFGPGQEANPAEYEFLMIASDGSGAGNLPALTDGQTLRGLGQQDSILRNLLSCEAGDFPVFWDVRKQLEPLDLQARMDAAGLKRAGHMSMGRLTIIEGQT